jgi:hypothetical protein
VGSLALVLLLSACDAVASLLTDTTPTPQALSSTALEQRLPEMLLESDDLPAGFVAWSEGYQRNEEILAEAGGDPNVARSLRESGRQTGYITLYQALEPTDATLEGIFVAFELFDTPELASDALYRDPREVTGVNMRRMTVEQLGDEAVAYSADAQGSTIFAVWFRVDRLTAALYTSNQAGTGSLEESRGLAERLLSRVKSAM